MGVRAYRTEDTWPGRTLISPRAAWKCQGSAGRGISRCNTEAPDVVFINISRVPNVPLLALSPPPLSFELFPSSYSRLFPFIILPSLFLFPFHYFLSRLSPPFYFSSSAVFYLTHFPSFFLLCYLLPSLLFHSPLLFSFLSLYFIFSLFYRLSFFFSPILPLPFLSLSPFLSYNVF